MFENRYDAGKQLGLKLAEYRGQPAVVLGIPNGGVPVALGVAIALEADLDLVISRKIPFPLDPEGGFGALADDGTIMLNEAAIKEAGLGKEQIDLQVSRVRADIRRRNLSYHSERMLSVLTGKTAIIVDDGLASGFTMLAAVGSVRNRRPREIVVAVPVASAAAVKQLEGVADRVVACIVNTAPRFYLSDFYGYWHDPDDAEVIRCLREWRVRRFRANIEPLQKKDG
ncbi:MAG: phosphoribosyl transferase [Chloroflexi bacterium]|nr:phosphoribosyl transferase [Chloroflexota bacterium]